MPKIIYLLTPLKNGIIHAKEKKEKTNIKKDCFNVSKRVVKFFKRTTN